MANHIIYILSGITAVVILCAWFYRQGLYRGRWESAKRIHKACEDDLRKAQQAHDDRISKLL